MLYEKNDISNICKTKIYTADCNMPIFKLMPYLSQSSFAIFLVFDKKLCIGKIYESDFNLIFDRYSTQTKLKDIVLKK